MELVSANTKNFLFLTISQYNEHKKLTRARVSMRRDQPFWAGGNSYIACESFRISAAPNEGGLYYQTLPSSFSISAGQAHTRTHGVSTLLESDAPPGFSTGNIQRLKDKAYATNISFAGQNVSMDLQVCAQQGAGAGQVAGGSSRPSLIESKYSDCVERLTKYIGLHKVCKGSRLKIHDKDDTSKHITFEVDKDPRFFFKAPGLGPSGLFIPQCYVRNVPGVLASDGPTLVDGPFTGLYRTNVEIHVQSQNSQAIQGAADESIWMRKVHELMGLGTYFSLNGPTVAGTHTDDLQLDQPFWRFAAPKGIEVDIPGAYSNHTTNGVITRVWNDLLRWSCPYPLKVGSSVWMSLGGVPTYGTVTAVGKWLEPLGISIKVTGDCAMLDSAIQACQNANPQVDRVDQGGRYMKITTTHLPLLETLSCSVHGIPFQDTNYPATADYSSGVSVAAIDAKGLYNIKRGVDTDKLLYTPNELFFEFNRQEPGVEKLPWTFQTDENGGFVVHWDNRGTTEKPAIPYEEFVISRPMCDSLGLNSFLTYYVGNETIPAAQKTYVCSVLQANYTDTILNTMTPITSLLNDIDSSQLLIASGETFVPVLENGDADWVLNQPLWTRHNGAVGDPTYLLQSVTTTDIAANSSQTLILQPTMRVNQAGIVEYVYQHPPDHAHIGNDAQVSVESWGTFAEINLVIPNLPFQPMLGSQTDNRILASLRLPFEYETDNSNSGQVTATSFAYYGDLLYNSDSSRSYLKITTDQQLYDLDVEARLIKRDGSMSVMQIPYKGQFQVKLRLLQTQ